MLNFTAVCHCGTTFTPLPGATLLPDPFHTGVLLCQCLACWAETWRRPGGTGHDPSRLPAALRTPKGDRP